MDRGWSVQSTSGSQVTCEIPMSTGQSILGQVLIGNSYSTPPRQFVQFNGGQIGGSSRVQIMQWMELQMAFGQTRRTDFNGPTAMNNEISLLLTAGGRLPPGTTFPNHVLMGVDGDDLPFEGKQGLRVKAIDEGSSAQVGGLLVNDIVYQIAGKRWKDYGSYLDATQKAAATAAYPVQILRDGKKLTLTLARAFRPPVVAPTIALAPPTQTPATVTSAPTSVADEIGKLASLRDKGLLTDAEFQSQKLRLLGGP